MTGSSLQLALKRKRLSRKGLFDATLSTFAIGMSLLAALPLLSVLGMLVQHGTENVGAATVTDLPPAAKEPGIGLGNAIQGTLLMVLLGALLALPTGIFAAVYLAVLGGRSWFASLVRFAAKMLTGMPSILAGVFAFGLLVIGVGFSPFAGGAALAVLMLPTIVLTAEEAIRAVPAKMEHAALAMGCTRTQTILKVTLPTAMPGILTGVVLAVARAAGETAPLLFTAGFSFFWIDWLDPIGDTSSLAVLIYTFSISPYDNWQSLAWTASLVLVLMVLILNLTAQYLVSRSPMARR